MAKHRKKQQWKQTKVDIMKVSDSSGFKDSKTERFLKDVILGLTSSEHLVKF